MNPQLYGILNYTPDSFYDGNKNFSVDQALVAAKTLLTSGASVVDVGAEATNPFVKPLTAKQEIERLSLVLPTLLKNFPGCVSLDTYHSETLEWALQFGKPVLNDVSGLQSTAMAQLAVARNLTCIVGHLPTGANGVPVNAHKFVVDTISEVVSDLKNRTTWLLAQGMKKENIILDPGIGFGKSMRLNWELVDTFAGLVTYPTMLGISHKRLLGRDEKTGLELPNADQLRSSKEKNIDAANRAIKSGVTYLRVHEPDWYQGLTATIM